MDHNPIAESSSSTTTAIPTAFVLIVESDTAWRDLLLDMLSMAGLSAVAVDSLSAAEELIRTRPVTLIVADVDQANGHAWFEWVRRDYPDVMVVITSESNDVGQAVEIMRRGAFDYVVRPFKVGDIIQSVERGLAQQALKTDNFDLKAALSLYGLADDLGRQMNLQEAITLLAATACREARADEVSIILRDRDSDPAAMMVGEGPRITFEDLSMAAQEKLAHTVEDGASVFDFIRPCRRTESVESLVIIPLIAHRAQMGWLVATRIRGRGFGEGHRKWLTILADRAAAAIHNAQLFETLETSFLQTIEALIATLEEKDHYTAGHSERVADLARRIAQELGLEPKAVELIHQGARLHDIGKLAIRTEELNKPGPLTEDEYERMKQHTLSGEALLRPIPFFHEIIPAVVGHHERLDGSGYPRGLKGDEIPLMARIVAVADAYDAMTSDRAYRQAMDSTEALAELKRFIGTHYDGQCVVALVEILERDA